MDITMDTRRNICIDLLKSIACLSVLIGHVLNGIIKADFVVTPLFYHLYRYVYLFHVPCFFFASGYLYANKQISNMRNYICFLSKKFIALGIPYLACSIFYVLLSSFFNSEMNPNTTYAIGSLFEIWKIPIAQYWYLYALLEMFIFVPIIEIIIGRGNKIYIWIGFIILAFLVRTNILCINYITQYSYLFYMGVVFNGLHMNKMKNGLPQHSYYFRGGMFGIIGIILYAIYVVAINLLPSGLDNILKTIIVPFLVLIMYLES